MLKILPTIHEHNIHIHYETENPYFTYTHIWPMILPIIYIFTHTYILLRILLILHTFILTLWQFIMPRILRLRLTHSLWQGYFLLYILSHIYYAKNTPYFIHVMHTIYIYFTRWRPIPHVILLIIYCFWFSPTTIMICGCVSMIYYQWLFVDQPSFV